ncbi:MAG: hypothetical protein KME08_01785 [Aphanothece sp. CMT-3BRIN-NPC111]|jgi:hypothetical protein|nr:hypothetical protein [Aphanothece sp. CMT-3BRIN-NPC111]
MKIKGFLTALLSISFLWLFYQYRLAQEQLLQAEAIVLYADYANEGDKLTYLDTAHKSLKEAITNLETIPDIPGSGYQQAQAILAKLRARLDTNEQRLQKEEQALAKLKAAQKLAKEASIMVRQSPHSSEALRNAQTKWQEAINLLMSIPDNTFASVPRQKTLSRVRNRYNAISNRLKIEKQP